MSPKCPSSPFFAHRWPTVRRRGLSAMLMGCLVSCLATVPPASAQPIASEAVANRLTYLDEFCNPYSFGLGAPRLTTPQWIGEPGVEAVVTFGIDDMRDPHKYEDFLRPLLTRLQKIDGRAPVSIMTNQVNVDNPLLQQWLHEGLSLETHTVDHPCPCLKDGDFAAAKATYDRCVDQICSIPGNHPVAFRFPCMDSLNTPSPRAFAEIINCTTPAGNFLQISTSVTCVFTNDDRELPQDLVLDEQGRARFEKYLPFPSFVNRVDNYPYPFVIGQLCWEFPCAVPDDWQGFHLQQPYNPQTVRDHQAVIDAVVLKQGVANFVFHPHGWIRNTQLVEIVDHAVSRYGSRVKFLTFRECADRLQQHLLAGQNLRSADGGDNGVRLLDVNHDGWMDVVIANTERQMTRRWDPQSARWVEANFPVILANSVRGSNSDRGTSSSVADRADSGTSSERRADVRFGVLQEGGAASLVAIGRQGLNVWHYRDGTWQADDLMSQGIHLDATLCEAAANGHDIGLRLRDLDLDGRCEVVVLHPSVRKVWRWQANGSQWQEEPTWVPGDAALVTADGHDAGLRWVDLNEDRYADVIVSDSTHYSVDLFDPRSGAGWRRVKQGAQGSAGNIPPIVRGATNNGVWFARQHLWVQNEDTHRLPDGIDRRTYAQLLSDQP